MFSSIVWFVGVMALLAPPSHSCSCAAMAAAAATPIEHEDALRRCRDLGGGALLGGVEVKDVISCRISFVSIVSISLCSS